MMSTFLTSNFNDKRYITPIKQNARITKTISANKKLILQIFRQMTYRKNNEESQGIALPNAHELTLVIW